MDQLITFVLLGLGPGALIAGIAVSIVLTYRGSGVINVAAGATAMLGAYLFFGLKSGYLFLPPFFFVPHRIDIGGPMATVPAILVTLVICGLVGALTDLVVYRPLRRSAPLAKLVASVGVLLVLQAIIVLRFGGDGQAAPAVLGDGVVHVFGAVVPTSRFVLAGIVAVLAATLAVVYRFSRFGLATRAAQENEAEALMSGLSPARISLVNSVLAATVTGGLGIVVAPLTQLDPSTLTLAVIPALAAALFARFTSFLLAGVAGLAMGVIQAVLTYLQTKSWFPTSDGIQIAGIAQLVYALIIVLALLWRGSALPRRGTLAEARLPAAPAARRMALPVGVFTVLGIAGCLFFSYDFRQALIFSLLGALACLSLVVVTGFVGQVSLLQFGLAGVAGLVTSKLALHAGIGFPLGPIIGVIAATVLGVAVAASALRIRGVQLAVVTLAGAVAVESFVFGNSSWGAGLSGSAVPTPHLFGLNLGPTADFPLGGGKLPSPAFALICLGAVVILGLLVASLRRGVLGKQMLAVRSNESAAACAGISPRRVKIGAFALSSFIAGLAGVLYGYNFGSIDSSHFGTLQALSLVAYAYIGGITTVTGSIIAGFLITEGLASHISSEWLGIPINYQLLLAGLGLLVTVITSPGGVALTGPPQIVRLLERGVAALRPTRLPVGEAKR